MLNIPCPHDNMQAIFPNGLRLGVAMETATNCLQYYSVIIDNLKQTSSGQRKGTSVKAKYHSRYCSNFNRMIRRKYESLKEVTTTRLWMLGGLREKLSSKKPNNDSGKLGGGGRVRAWFQSSESISVAADFGFPS